MQVWWLIVIGLLRNTTNHIPFFRQTIRLLPVQCILDLNALLITISWCNFNYRLLLIKSFELVVIIKNSLFFFSLDARLHWFCKLHRKNLLFFISFFKVFSMVKTKWFSIKTNGFQVYLFLLAIAYVHGQWNICNFSQAKSLNFIAYVLVQAWLKSTFKKRKVILIFLKFNYVNLDLSRLSLNENKIACFKVKLNWTRGLFFIFPP